MILHISDGGKGGVGKSTTATALINYLSGIGERVYIIETDTLNPDVKRSTEKTGREVLSTFANLRDEDGWNHFLELLENQSEAIDHAVVSLPGSDIGVQKYKDLLFGVMESLSIPLYHYFTINRQLDSISLYKESLKSGFGAIANKHIVILNGAFGERQKFERWDDSKPKNVKFDEVFLPELYWKTVDSFQVAGVTYDEFSESATSPLVKSRINKWVSDINGEFKRISAHGSDA